MRRAERPLRLAALLLALVLAAAAADEEEDATRRLDEVEHAIRQAEAARAALGEEAAGIADELDRLRASLLAAEAAMRAQEATLEEISLTLETLDAELADRRRTLDARRDEFALVLAALQRIALQPAEMLLALPGSPTDTHRTAMLLAALTPELDRRASEIATEIAALVELEREVEAQRAAQTAAVQQLAVERAASAAATIRKRELLAGVRREDSVLEDEQSRLAEEAESLQELLDVLARRDDGLPTALGGVAVVEALAASSFTAQQGRLALPAAGTIATQFGGILPSGADSEGIVIETASGSRVVTPYDGKVVYAGPFRDYGHLLIIDHGEGYHTVLAGMARAEAVVGQILLAGEPVGAMSADGGGRPRLYVELRHRGAPINPLPWMTAGAN